MTDVVDERFPRKYRLRTRTDFDRVYQNDAYAADRVLVVRGCKNGLPYPRLGLSVSRKVGGAVVRNRWKRLIREVFRKCRSELPVGLDLVFRPRRGAEPDYAAISESLPKVARQLAKRLGRQRQ